MSTSGLAGMEGDESDAAVFSFANTFPYKLNSKYMVVCIHSCTWYRDTEHYAACESGTFNCNFFNLFPRNVTLKLAVAQLTEEVTVKCHVIHVK